MQNFRDMIFELEKYGVSDVLLPFILIFTVTFAILQKTNVLGKKKQFNVMIAFVMGLTFVIPHITGNYNSVDPVVFVNNFLPYIILSIIVFFSMVLIMQGFSVNPIKDLKQSYPFVALFAVIINGMFGHLFPELASIVLIITIVITIFLIMNAKSSGENRVPVWIFFIIVAIVLWIGLWAAGVERSPYFLEFMTTDSFRNNLIWISVILIAVLFVSKEDSKN